MGVHVCVRVHACARILDTWLCQSLQVAAVAQGPHLLSHKVPVCSEQERCRRSLARP